MGNVVDQKLTNRLYEIADTIGGTVYLDKGALAGQVKHKRNFSGVKVDHTLTIIESALTADKSAALVRGPGNLLFLVMKGEGTPTQLHLFDASKLDGEPAEIFKKSKYDKDVSQHFMAAFVKSFTKQGKSKWEPTQKVH